MKMRMMGMIALALLLAQPAHAQRGVEDEPGFVDLSSLTTLFDVEPTVEVNIHGALLRLVAEASRWEDPDLADLLFRLRGVYVRGFDLGRVDEEDAIRQARRLGRQLERDGWDVFIRVQDRDESVYMYVKVIDDAIAGMVVMAIEPQNDDTIFLNIVGEIDPEQIGRIGRKFDVRSLREW